jgi:Rieske Fe-S protein
MLDRREFLKALAAGTVGALVLLPGRKAFAKKVAVGLDKAQSLKTVGQGALLRIQGTQVLVVRDGETSVRALDPTCTHQGCIVGWDPDAKRVRCPCHASGFDLDGKVLEGPAPKPLRTIPAQLDGDRVILTLPD